MRMYENQTKIVCKFSRVKSDDYSLKGLTPSHRMCDRCDNYAIEISNVKHILMQCPAFEQLHTKMFIEIRDLSTSLDDKVAKHPS